MSRSYRVVRPKLKRVHSVEHVLSLYGICRNTLSNWVKAGLRPVDEHSPQLFNGAELAWFHYQRHVVEKRPCPLAEFNCFKCKAHVIPETSTLSIEPRDNARFRANATCPDCGGIIGKYLDAAACDKLRDCLDSNTSLRSIDEGAASTPVGIGIKPQPDQPNWLPENERTIFRYQEYQGRLDEKTIDAHVAAIRDFEIFVDGKAFTTCTTSDATRYRETLARRRKDGLQRLSPSTMRHMASQIKAFFDWLVQQDGCHRMSKQMGDHFKLGKKDLAESLQRRPRDFPTTEEVVKLIASMPFSTLLDRRNRAMVCLSFSAGTRANATASLLMKHIDVDKNVVLQDATEVRVKNSKSQTTRFFPVGDRIIQFFKGWVFELKDLGLEPDDALFPPDAALTCPGVFRRTGHARIAPHKTDGAVRKAFKEACNRAGLPYFNPHSARHYLQSIRDLHCFSPQDRKAWTHNLGHQKEETSERHYGKITDKERDLQFDRFGSRQYGTEDEKDLVLQFNFNQLTPGTSEFFRAEKLDEEWRAKARSKRRTLVTDGS